MGRPPPHQALQGPPGPHAGLSFPRLSVGMPCPGGTTGLVFPRLNIELPQPCWRPKPPGVWGPGLPPVSLRGSLEKLPNWAGVWVHEVQVGAGQPPREGLFALGCGWLCLGPPPLRSARLSGPHFRPIWRSLGPVAPLRSDPGQRPATRTCPTLPSEGLLSGDGVGPRRWAGPFSAPEASCSGSGGVGEGPLVPADCGRDRQSPSGEARHTRVSVCTRVGPRL